MNAIKHFEEILKIPRESGKEEKIANYSSIKSYLILYHEACVVNLIENFLYSITACQAAEDYIIDIIEYAYKMISKYVNYKTLHQNQNHPTYNRFF